MKLKEKFGLTLAIALLVGAGISAKALRPDDDEKKPQKAAEKAPETSVVDEVVWVVGDEPILKSDVEVMRLQGEAEGVKYSGNPDCLIPEQIAVQKLFKHQAEIDSIEVTESEISQDMEMQIDFWIQAAGSREKLEEWKGQTVSQMRQSMHDDFKDRLLIQRMREKLVEDVTVTPADVRNHFKGLPEDSLPYIPTEVEVQIITKSPKIPAEEINRVKDQLRDYTDRVTKGETSFAALARLYSEDAVSARQGGELGYMGRGMLDPAFASVAFNLTDAKKISKIVETEFGFHIIQLIDKRGDKINCRHILLKPRVDQEELEKTTVKLDSIATDLRAGKFSFEEAATFISDDKDTRNNHGLMANVTRDGRTSRFKMADLPSEVAKVIDGMEVGAVSAPFQMMNERGKAVCAIVKLKNRREGHKATITEDFQIMKNVVTAKQREKVLHEWVVNRIKSTYVRLNERYRDCKFEYEGWVK